MVSDPHDLGATAIGGLGGVRGHVVRACLSPSITRGVASGRYGLSPRSYGGNRASYAGVLITPISRPCSRVTRRQAIRARDMGVGGCGKVSICLSATPSTGTAPTLSSTVAVRTGTRVAKVSTLSGLIATLIAVVRRLGST